MLSVIPPIFADAFVQITSKCLVLIEKNTVVIALFLPILCILGTLNKFQEPMVGPHFFIIRQHLMY